MFSRLIEVDQSFDAIAEAQGYASALSAHKRNLCPRLYDAQADRGGFVKSRNEPPRAVVGRSHIDEHSGLFGVKLQRVFPCWQDLSCRSRNKWFLASIISTISRNIHPEDGSDISENGLKSAREGFLLYFGQWPSMRSDLAPPPYDAPAWFCQADRIQQRFNTSEPSTLMSVITATSRKTLTSVSVSRKRSCEPSKL